MQGATRIGSSISRADACRMAGRPSIEIRGPRRRNELSTGTVDETVDAGDHLENNAGSGQCSGSLPQSLSGVRNRIAAQAANSFLRKRGDWRRELCASGGGVKPLGMSLGIVRSSAAGRASAGKRRA